MKYIDWLDQWLTLCVKPAAKQRTFEKYSRICRTHLAALGQYQTDELTANVLQHFVSTRLRCSPNTANVVISVLKNSLKKAVVYGVTKQEHTSAIMRPRPCEKKIECFTRDEQKAIENYILNSRKYKLVGILLSLYSGLRIGELLALTWSDVDFAMGTISVTKSCHDSYDTNGYHKVIETPKTHCSVRLIPMPKQLVNVLRDAKRAVGGTYVVGGDATVSVRSYQRTFELLQRKLHICHRGFHALRHTFATRAIECGMDVKTLAEILGHKNTQITLNRYVHSLMEHKRAMMDKVGKLLQ